MPLVLVHKARKPSWQDTVPRDPELREAYRIANSHYREFAKAYQRAVGGVVDDVAAKRLLSALAEGDVPAVQRAVPWLDPSDQDSVERWGRVQDEFAATYGKVLAESAASTIDELGVSMSFEMDNPYSASWAAEHAGEVIREITEAGREAVNAAVVEGFRVGNGARGMASTIRSSIGLTEREAVAVQRRLSLHLGSGVEEDLAARRASTYANSLLSQRAERIARTETITAENKGTMDAWQVARDEGLLPAKAMKRWIEARGSSRTCPVCEELGAMDPIPLDEAWETEAEGEVMMPPAHPSCRCSMGIVLP